MTATSILSNLCRVIVSPAPRMKLPRFHDLEAGEILSICKPAGHRIQCNSGLIWVTQDNDPRDILLEPGESLRIDGNARVLLQALQTASVAVLR